MKMTVVTMVLAVFIAGCASFGTTGGSNSATDIAQKGIAQLVQLGTPIECTFKWMDPDTGEKADAKAYFKGKSSRIEIKAYGAKADGDEQCDKLITVMNDREKKIYMGCDPLPVKEECKWLLFDYSNVEDADAESQGGLTSKDLESLPPGDFSCGPAIFGDEKFTVQGKACSIQDMMAKAMTEAMSQSQTETTTVTEGASPGY